MKKISILIALLFVSAQFAAAKTIDIFHTSDVHGSYFARPAKKVYGDDPDRMMGGFATLKAMLKKEKTPYIMLDSGDMFQGTPEGIFTRGEASIDYMNKIGYSAVVPGNHEFDYGQLLVVGLAKRAKFPFLAANIYIEGSNERPDWVKPYIIIKKAGKRIAVFGLAGKHTKTHSNPKNTFGLDFRDEAAEAKKIVAEIKEKEKPDAIICIAHLGSDEHFSRSIVDELPDYVTEHCRSCRRLFPDREYEEFLPRGIQHVARAARDIDLILGGDFHTGLAKGHKDDVTGISIGESYTNLMFTTKAELNFNDKTGKLESVNVKLVPLWTDVYGQDKGILKMDAKLKAKIDETMLQKVGYTEGELSFSSENLDSKIGNWICDLTKDAVGAQMGFQNTGGIRVELPKGDITMGDLYRVMPFDNTIVTMKMTGKALKRMIAESYENESAGMQISGLKVEILPARDGKHDFRLFDSSGKLIEDTDEYIIATNNYLADGGNYGAAFKEEGTEAKDSKLVFRDIMREALEKGSLPEQQTGRYVRISAEQYEAELAAAAEAEAAAKAAEAEARAAEEAARKAAEAAKKKAAKPAKNPVKKTVKSPAKKK